MEYVYRYDLMNKIIKRFGFKNYLEIGVCVPSDCFDRIEIGDKVGVDPGLENPENPVKYQMDSDTFFQMLESGLLDLPRDHKWDLIFIDGLHISHQVLKDIENSLSHLKDGGYIMLHDCNPPAYFNQREDYYIDGKQMPWTGTVWKAIYYLRAHRSDLKVCVLNTDWGVGVIRRENSQTIPFSNQFYEFNSMASDRRKNIGLIEVSEFDEWLNAKETGVNLNI
jgi:hypothetical protein